MCTTRTAPKPTENGQCSHRIWMPMFSLFSILSMTIIHFSSFLCLSSLWHEINAKIVLLRLKCQLTEMIFKVTATLSINEQISMFVVLYHHIFIEYIIVSERGFCIGCFRVLSLILYGFFRYMITRHFSPNVYTPCISNRIIDTIWKQNLCHIF